MRNLTLLSLVALLLTSGCAHQAKLNQAKLTSSEQSPSNWEERMREARQKGEAAETFLATELFLKGNSALMEGDYATGVAHFRHLVQLTDDVFVHKKYAVALIRMGELDEARQVLEKLQARGVKDEAVGLILGGVYGAQDKTHEARQAYQRVLAHNPRQEDACLFLGKMLMADKKWGEAESWMNKCQAQHPKEGTFSYYVGKMHVEQGHFKAALKAFEAAHRREPTSTQAAAALGVIYEQQEQPERALGVYQRHLKVKPDDEVILGRLVQALFLLERFQEVVPYAEKLVDLEPDNLNMRVKLGILYTDAKEFDKAVSVFRELLALAPQSDKILYYLGAIHQEQRKYEQAIDYFTQIPTSSGLYQDSSYQLASILGGLAQAEFNETSQVGPYGARFVAVVNAKLSEIPELKVELSVLKANFFETTEKDSEAIEALTAAKGEKSFGLQHSYYLASLLEKAQRFKESTEVIMALIDADPKNAHAWNFLGYSLLERGSAPDEALPYIQKAVALAPEDGYIRDSLGWYYFKTGQITQALRELQFAYAKAPDDIVIAKHLALIHQHLKNYSQANKYFQAALVNAKLNSERREVVGLIKALEAQRLPASAVPGLND